MEEPLNRVISIAAEGIRFAWGLEGHLQRLNKSLTMIQAKLQDAATRPVTDKSVKLWLERLKDVAYDADDVVDEFANEILRKDQKKGKVLDFMSLHNSVPFRLSMGRKVKKIKETLDEILEDAVGSGLGLTSLQHEDRAQEWIPWRQRSSMEQWRWKLRQTRIVISVWKTLRVHVKAKQRSGLY